VRWQLYPSRKSLLSSSPGLPPYPAEGNDTIPLPGYLLIYYPCIGNHLQNVVLSRYFFPKYVSRFQRRPFRTQKRHLAAIFGKASSASAAKAGLREIYPSIGSITTFGKLTV
jgi:hypothetical protein